MEVQGLAIPAHGRSLGAIASSRELRRRSRARHPHFEVAQAQGFDAASTLTAMDIEGIDVAVMYGTRGRQVLSHDNLPPDYTAALARAYNNWTHDYCAHDPTRLKFAGQVAMHDIPSAIAEARRCVTELGAVAIIGTPNPVDGQHLHDEACEPLWAEIEWLAVPVGFYPTGETSLRDDAGRRYVGHANFHPIAHAIRNPVELMGAIASMTTGGVLERHPGLRCAFLEGTSNLRRGANPCRLHHGHIFKLDVVATATGDPSGRLHTESSDITDDRSAYGLWLGRPTKPRLDTRGPR